jgi:hypothetical protein
MAITCRSHNFSVEISHDRWKLPRSRARLKTQALFRTHRPYLLWTVVSACWLTATCFIDAYLFGFSAFATAFVSTILVLVSLSVAPKTLPVALISALPTGVAFILLSTYNWP